MMFGTSGSKFLPVGSFFISLVPTVVKSKRSLGHTSHLFQENKIGKPFPLETVPRASAPSDPQADDHYTSSELRNSTPNVTPNELFFRTTVSGVIRTLCMERFVWAVSEHAISTLESCSKDRPTPLCGKWCTSAAFPLPLESQDLKENQPTKLASQFAPGLLFHASAILENQIQMLVNYPMFYFELGNCRVCLWTWMREIWATSQLQPSVGAVSEEAQDSQPPSTTGTLEQARWRRARYVIWPSCVLRVQRARMKVLRKWFLWATVL